MKLQKGYGREYPLLPMRKFAPIPVSFLVGALAASIVLWPLNRETRLPLPEQGAVLPDGSSQQQESSSDFRAQLDRIESSVSRLGTIVLDLDRRLEAVLRHLEARRTVAKTPAPPVVDEFALQRAIETAAEKKERARYDSLTNQQLLAEAKRLHHYGKDPSVPDALSISFLPATWIPGIARWR